VSGPPPDWVEVNRQNWEERVPIHVSSSFYDVDGFVAGKPALEPFEIDELGPLGDLRLAHLQCHFGLDVLDLVRLHPGLSAVGLDFSAHAVAAAESLAERVGLSSRCSFVQSDVMSASSVLGQSAFDVVYTGKGAICWLNDLSRWAAECFALLRPGGFLYVSEFHPVGYALATSSPTVGDDYFRTDPWVDDVVGSYADLSAITENNMSVSWNHPLPAIFSAVIAAGFHLRFFHEYDYTLFRLNDWLIEGDDGRWRWPSPDRRLPLMFSLKAYKPESSGLSIGDDGL
jgi:SAM-dependent methyltransferase